MKSTSIKNVLMLSLLTLMSACIQSDTPVQSDISTEVVVEPKIKLFVYKTCPYCHKVINYLKSINKLDQVVLVDAGVAGNKSELIQLSGSTQCPFLRDEIKDVSMLESSDIIKYFSTRF